MYPIVSCAGVGLYPKMLPGIESNAWARRCWNVIVRCFMTAVTGFDGGCWPLSVIGKATTASMTRENLMRSLSLRMIVSQSVFAATYCTVRWRRQRRVGPPKAHDGPTLPLANGPWSRPPAVPGLPHLGLRRRYEVARGSAHSEERCRPSDASLIGVYERDFRRRG